MIHGGRSYIPVTPLSKKVLLVQVRIMHFSLLFEFLCVKRGVEEDLIQIVTLRRFQWLCKRILQCNTTPL